MLYKKQWKTLTAKQQFIAEEIVKQFGTAEELLIKFAPDKQQEYVSKYLDRCFNGNAPSITRVGFTYGTNVSISWLRIQISELMLYAGIKEKPNVQTIDGICGVVMSNYGYLKLTEFMVFFQRFKAGKYGSFYGVIDGLKITEALNEFLEYRKHMIRLWYKTKQN